jgi:hypothetical protein
MSAEEGFAVATKPFQQLSINDSRREESRTRKRIIVAIFDRVSRDYASSLHN